MEDNLPCPKCGYKYATPVEFTWWGGWRRWDMLGIYKRFNLVKCRNCGATYNGKTGMQETKKIVTRVVIINLVLTVIGVLFVLFVFYAIRRWF
jgi:predicted nucleic-acid-binding Zn-ribbon protein